MTSVTLPVVQEILNSIDLLAPQQTCGDAVNSLKINENIVELQLGLGYPVTEAFLAALSVRIEDQLKQRGFVTKLKLSVVLKVGSHNASNNPPLPGIKNLIGVASGKGGVGKSTTSVNLALALMQAGAKVGLLDADIYGPNQPKMLGVAGRAAFNSEKKLIPVECFGIKTMSMGYLVDKQTPMVWRGPMISQALHQLAQDTCWGELDYLIVDLPPGTGDIQLTLAKKFPVSGAVIVTTPQEVALLDAEKALHMFNKVGVPVLGLIENMSIHVCSKCGHTEALFGSQGGERMAAEFKLPLLGKMPLNRSIREASDAGVPIVIAAPDSDIARGYQDAAMKLAACLSVRSKSYAHLFTEVVVEKG